MLQTDLTFARRRISELVPDAHNARVHGERNLEAIKNSLREFGQVAPLVVQASTGRVIGGNGTLQAMQALGWTEADVALVQINEARASALAIALNRTAELATWDMDALGKLLSDLGDMDPETIGFSSEELDRILNRGLDAPSDLPEEEEPGDIDAPPDGEAATVKMVQLFYDEKTHAEFIRITDAAAQALKTDNISETVYAVLHRAWNDLSVFPDTDAE